MPLQESCTRRTNPATVLYYFYGTEVCCFNRFYVKLNSSFKIYFLFQAHSLFRLNFRTSIKKFPKKCALILEYFEIRDVAISDSKNSVWSKIDTPQEKKSCFISYQFSQEGLVECFWGSSAQKQIMQSNLINIASNWHADVKH